MVLLQTTTIQGELLIKAAVRIQSIARGKQARQEVDELRWRKRLETLREVEWRDKLAELEAWEATPDAYLPTRDHHRLLCERHRKQRLAKLLRKLEKYDVNAGFDALRFALARGYKDKTKKFTASCTDPARVKAAFLEMDQNKNYRVSYMEFGFAIAAWVPGTVELLTGLSEPECFRMMDLNGDGVITLNEVLNTGKTEEKGFSKGWTTALRKLRENSKEYGSLKKWLEIFRWESLLCKSAKHVAKSRFRGAGLALRWA